MSAPRRGEIYWANLDPTIGREIRKRRPVLIVSPDEMNRALKTVIAAPLTSKLRAWPTRCTVQLRGRPRSAALDQMRCLDVRRLAGKLGQTDPAPALTILRTMFAA
jgi:mRNA interferase MazF